jgi:hypothetical protein
VELDNLLELGSDDLRTLFHARARRRLSRGLRRKPMGLVRKLRAAKQNAAPNEKASVWLQLALFSNGPRWTRMLTGSRLFSLPNAEPTSET